MWVANQWKDYEVIDTSAGEKLERWGKYILVRPDPQVIWETPKGTRVGKTETDITIGAVKEAENGNFLTCRTDGTSVISRLFSIYSHFSLNIQGSSQNRQSTGNGLVKRFRMQDGQLKY